MVTSPGIKTRALACGYDGQAILTDVNLDLPGGGITCILGGSGCGKSTLLRTLLLLEPPIAGDILFGRQSVQDLDRDDLADLRRRVGVLFQGSALFNSMTLLENAAFPILECTDVGREVAHELALRKLQVVGLARYAHYLPSSVSGGMRKRCGIARALALDPPYLFLDEPSAGLDPLTSAGIDRLIQGIRDTVGTTVVLVTHELPSIEAIGEYLVMLEGGGVLAQGEASELRAHPAPGVRTFFERRVPEEPPPSGGLGSLLLP